MRRALLTPAQKASGPPFTVGETAFDAPSAGTSGPRWSLSNPATRDGTITSVSLGAFGAGTVEFFTGAQSGSNFSVRAVSDALTVASGTNTFTVNLPVLAGDFIGAWAPLSILGTVSLNGATYGLAPSGSEPYPGALYVTSSAAKHYLCLNATGA